MNGNTVDALLTTRTVPVDAGYSVTNLETIIPGDGITWREEPVPSDAESVRDIVLSSGFFSAEEKEIAVELVRERLQKGLSSGYFFLFAEEQGRVTGYACFGPIPGTRDGYDLYWIAVMDEMRGLGTGKGILARAERKIRDSGGRRIYIETSSRERYRPTRAFYHKSGYVREAVLKDFYAPGDDKIIYVKTV